MPDIETVDPVNAAARLAECVREAGALALSMFQMPIRNWTKGASSSPVCEADIAVDGLLRERLANDGTDFGWLSEESPEDPHRRTARYVWIVDPIDGTRAYLAGRSDWTISVALAENGRPIVACLYAPVSNELLLAARGNGATCNGAAIAATPGSSLAQMSIAGPRGLLDRLATTAPPFRPVSRVHSLALRLARVAQGLIDVAFAGENSHDWDLAAADLLVHEAGGALTSLAGGVVTYNGPVLRHGALVAAGRDRHATLIDFFRDGRLGSP